VLEDQMLTNEEEKTRMDTYKGNHILVLKECKKPCAHFDKSCPQPTPAAIYLHWHARYTWREPKSYYLNH